MHTTSLQLPNYLQVKKYIRLRPERVLNRVVTKWRFQYLTKYDYRFLLDVVIAIIAIFR
jgi:hypothetical protein